MHTVSLAVNRREAVPYRTDGGAASVDPQDCRPASVGGPMWLRPRPQQREHRDAYPMDGRSQNSEAVRGEVERGPWRAQGGRMKL